MNGRAEWTFGGSDPRSQSRTTLRLETELTWSEKNQEGRGNARWSQRRVGGEGNLKVVGLERGDGKRRVPRGPSEYLRIFGRVEETEWPSAGHFSPQNVKAVGRGTVTPATLLASQDNTLPDHTRHQG